MEEFKKKLIDEIEKRKGSECKIIGNTVVKVNDEVLHAIAIVNENGKISKNVYLESYLEEYKNNRTLGSIVNEIIQIIMCKNEAEKRCMEFVESIDDYKLVKDKVMIKLINKEFNELYLEDKCYVPYLDFAVLFYILLECDKREIGSIAVTKRLVDMWQVSIEEMHSQAIENVKNKFPATIENLNTLLVKALEDIEEFSEDSSILTDKSNDMNLYVFSNENHINGAISMIFTDMLEKFANENKVEEVIIIPSSVHEVLLYPKYKNGDITEEKCLEMLIDVNRTSVEQGELLSNNIYVYNVSKNETRIWNK